jgi:hypothetical protein
MSVGNFSFLSTTRSMVNTTESTGGGISVSLSNFNKLEGTMEFWVNAREYSGSNGLFVNRVDSTVNASNWLWFGPYDSGRNTYLRLGDGASCCTQDIWMPAAPPPGEWVQMFATWSDTAKQTRVGWNGSVLARQTITAIPNSSPSTTGRIGIGHLNTTAQFVGQIAIVRFYNRALTEAELRQNFNANRARFGR